MTSAIGTPIVFPDSPAQKTTFKGPESFVTARDFARIMDQAAMVPGAETRNSAGRMLTSVAFSDEEEDSEADEVSKNQVSPEEENAPAAPPPTWLAGLLATVFAQPLLNPGQTDNSVPSSGECSLEGNPSGSGGRELHVEADDGSATGVIHPDTLLDSADQPLPTGPGPDTAATTGEASPRGRLASEFSLLSESIDPIPVFTQPARAKAQGSNALAELSSLAGNDASTVQPGASQAEASKVGSGNALTAISSDSGPAVAASFQASGVEEPSAHERALITAVSEHGTSAAEHAGTMQATHEMNKNAALAEQNLPALVAALEAAAPAGRERQARANALDRNADIPVGAAEMAFTLANHPTGHELSAYAAADAPQTVVVESVRRAIENAATGLRRIDASSLSLVLTPDSNTQLALYVKLQQGRFEVVAVLERGDFAALGAEWSQLQNRLTEQGVRLAPLVAGAEQGNWVLGERSFSGKRGREEMPSGDLPVPAMARTEARKSGARTVTAFNRSEWWA